VAELKLVGVGNRFVKNIDLYVADGDTCAIVGPSGAGKTSLLRIIAGLDPHKGRVLIDQQEVQSLPPNRRAIGFVSQDLHLFPHLSIEGNVFLAMNRLKTSRNHRRRRAAELMELLRITHLSGRKPDTYSGGEKQRAALARTLASSPRLLLLDEPFSKLDFRTARYLRTEFKNLLKKLGLTTIIVTHDLEEAAHLAKTLLVMRSGSLTASDLPVGSAKQEKDHVDFFLETPNVLSCRTIRVMDNCLVEVEWAGGLLLIPDEGGPFSRFAVGRRDIEIGPTPPQGPPVNRFMGSIGSVETGEDSTLVVLDVNGATVRVETSHERWNQMCLMPEDKVHGFIRLRALQAC
jgi:ABC-type sugar transport system ATPase subunit